MDSVVLSELAAIARRGARKAAAGLVDAEEYSEISCFVAVCLENQRDEDILTLKSYLDDPTAAAKAWFLDIVRTHAGTTTIEDKLCHLVLLPIRLSASRERPCSAPCSALEAMASGLEEILDLGYGSLRFESEIYPVGVLEDLLPSQCFSIVRGEPAQQILPCGASPGKLGVLLGRWYVDKGDRKRLLVKLSQASNSRIMTSWRMRTETALGESLPGAKVRVFWPMLLQHAYTGARLIELGSMLEEAVKKYPCRKTLEWRWEKPRALQWSLPDTEAPLVSGSVCFPEEPPELPVTRLQALAKQMGLTAKPAD